MEFARGNTGTRHGVRTHGSTCQSTGEATRGAARRGATRGAALDDNPQVIFFVA